MEEKKQGNVTIKTIEKVLEALKLNKELQSTYAISNLEQLNYNSTLTALEYLEKENKVERVKSSSGIFWRVVTE